VNQRSLGTIFVVLLLFSSGLSAATPPDHQTQWRIIQMALDFELSDEQELIKSSVRKGVTKSCRVVSSVTNVTNYLN